VYIANGFFPSKKKTSQGPVGGIQRHIYDSIFINVVPDSIPNGISLSLAYNVLAPNATRKLPVNRIVRPLSLSLFRVQVKGVVVLGPRIGLSVCLLGMTKLSTLKKLSLGTPVLILMLKNLTPCCSSQGTSRVKLSSETGGSSFLSPT